jgi:hypothetical protein
MVKTDFRMFCPQSRLLVIKPTNTNTGTHPQVPITLNPSCVPSLTTSYTNIFLSQCKHIFKSTKDYFVTEINVNNITKLFITPYTRILCETERRSM